ncbi:MAG: NAD-dependent epimerase/dehydratase family protein, partial [Acidimicrobiia bacterium]
MRVAVTGSTGRIGSVLLPALDAAGHDVVRVVRDEAGSGPDAVVWDPVAGTIDAAGLEGVDAVVHLSGARIGDHRFTEEEKERLWESRVNTTRLLAETLAGLDRKPSVLLCASAIGYYGDRGDVILTEEDGPGDGFLAALCVQWEAATGTAVEAGIRVVNTRSGLVLRVVLDRMFAPFKAVPFFNPYRLGLGGRLGSGRQYWSWIA